LIEKAKAGSKINQEYQHDNFRGDEKNRRSGDVVVRYPKQFQSFISALEERTQLQAALMQLLSVG
jgi:hypothetical protein